MHCSKCGNDESKVLESRDTGSSIRRRRECSKCGNRYTTYERVERPNLAVLKTSGSRELFDREKLKRAIFNSVGKFINGEIETEEIVQQIEDSLYHLGESEVASRQIGDLVLQELAKRNEVAYVRFASVFRKFKNADEFVETLQELRDKRQ
ncbi:MAG: transcriptional regulator NrdR [Candidatus Nomurabacteria bacterium]|jgi:transcriptional repressor NrdR|nr:transcriptional regulator NrdR [Candidatus Nomurabacteria bacterium]